jgi:hypothetical protein
MVARDHAMDGALRDGHPANLAACFECIRRYTAPYHRPPAIRVMFKSNFSGVDTSAIGIPHPQTSLRSAAPCARPFNTHGTFVRCCQFDAEENSMIEVTRVQTGVRLESSLLKVLKALAAYTDLGLGDLLEGICLHAFEGKQPFSPETLEQIDRFRHIYGLSLTAADSHRLTEQPSGRAARSAPKKKHKTRR